jgi:2-oxoglutarate dehydrogenase E2 component (dihydrolipoamide succinyltransferase)
MAIEVKIPSVGESITEGVLGSWKKKNGEYVRQGDVLFEIETDKVTSEVYAQADGAISTLVPDGTTVKIGQIVGKIDETAKPPAGATPSPVAVDSVKSEDSSDRETNGGSAPLSPAVRLLVEEHKVDPAQIKGTGKGGRLLKEDVIAHVQNRSTSAATVTVEATVAATPAPEPTKPAVVPAPAGQRTTRTRMSPLRKKIADRLVSAQHTAAILTTFNEVDMIAVMTTRSKFQDRFTAKHGVKLGFMSFFVKAVVHALKVVPSINGRVEGDEIISNHYYDIGVAIGTEKGLIVPVIRNVDQLNMAQIEQAIIDYAKRGRAGKITLSDLEGGVFTISNGGVYGSMLSTPILNPPQSGILGMHSIQERAMVVNGKVEVRPMMYLALSYDHRIVDGKEAVTFLVNVKEFIENPGLALLDL